MFWWDRNRGDIDVYYFNIRAADIRVIIALGDWITIKALRALSVLSALVVNQR